MRAKQTVLGLVVLAAGVGLLGQTRAMAGEDKIPTQNIQFRDYNGKLLCDGFQYQEPIADILFGTNTVSPGLFPASFPICPMSGQYIGSIEASLVVPAPHFPGADYCDGEKLYTYQLDRYYQTWKLIETTAPSIAGNSIPQQKYVLNCGTYEVVPGAPSGCFGTALSFKPTTPYPPGFCGNPGN